MPAGRKPKPTHLKLVEGNPGKRAIKSGEPMPDQALPVECPDYLPPRAKVEWHRLAPELRRLGVLTAVDISVFASYCNSFARWRDAEEALAQMALLDPVSKALMVRTGKGTLIQNPLVGIANHAMRDMLSYGSELGLTPASRVRLATDGPPPGAGRDPLARLMAMANA